MILGDLGAEIIKVEHPEGGDDTRRWGPPFLEPKGQGHQRESAYFMCVNRNKKSVAINLKSKKGKKYHLYFKKKSLTPTPFRR